MDKTKLHIAILSSPGAGHLIPVILLGNRLATHHHVHHVTILVVSANSSKPELHLLRSLTGSSTTKVNIIKIPAVDISTILHPNAAVVTKLVAMMRKTRPGIRSAISSMDPRPNVLISDLFSTQSFPIADEFGMAKYVYFPSSARALSLTVYCRVFDLEVEGQYVDRKEPLVIPGCKPVRPEDVTDPMLDRENQQYREYVRMSLDISSSHGVLSNTWEDLERTTLEALNRNETLRSVLKAPVYPIGPLSRPVDAIGSKNEVIKWLDMQPNESVLYVSFGSGGTISAEQLTELAWGLELSRARFVWVVRPPVGTTADGCFFMAESGSNDGTLREYLPEGFSTRTQKMGLVVPLWSPQVEILKHPSVGGFLSHCGWNSTMETIAGGVPIIAWPLYAEQKLNATLLTEELMVAVRPAVLPTKKLVERVEIEKMVRRLMESEEGKRMRKKVKELRKSAEEASSDSGGSSYNSMREFIKDCQMKILSR